jgi:hypothetical protein
MALVGWLGQRLHRSTQHSKISDISRQMRCVAQKTLETVVNDAQENKKMMKIPISLSF